MRSPEPHCANCRSTCAGLFCSMACAVERYAIIHEALTAIEAEARWLRKQVRSDESANIGNVRNRMPGMRRKPPQAPQLVLTGLAGGRAPDESGPAL